MTTQERWQLAPVCLTTLEHLLTVDLSVASTLIVPVTEPVLEKDVLIHVQAPVDPMLNARLSITNLSADVHQAMMEIHSESAELSSKPQLSELLRS